MDLYGKVILQLYITLTTNFNPENGGSTVSETLFSNNYTTLYNNTEHHEFYTILYSIY
jgi:hypothetical protein